MNIKTSHFCGLSSATDFRGWLKSTALDLYDELVNTPIKGCKSKQEKMITIKDKLYNRGKGDELEAFIKRRYPYMISEDPSTPSQKITTKKAKVQPKIVKSRLDHIEIINKHKVFKHYRPDLLTFPQKYIIVGDPLKLPDLIKSFVADKVGVDFIIVDDHAYIEYFKRKYSDIVDKIKPETREIWTYRQQQKQHDAISKA